MKNHFLISNEEKNRIRNLHESTKQSHGTGSLLKEAYNEYVSWETLEQNNERVVFFVGINNPNGRQGLNNPDSLVTENTHLEANSLEILLPKAQYDKGDEITVVLNVPEGFVIRGGSFIPQIDGDIEEESRNWGQGEAGRNKQLIKITIEIDDKFINMIGADFQGPAGDRSGMRGAFVDSLGNIGIRARVQGNVEGGTFQCTIMFSKGSMIIENDDWF